MKVPEENNPPLSSLEQSLKRVLLEKAANTDSRLAERVLTVIGGRTPRQLSVEQTLHIMRAVSAVAALVLVALLLSIGLRSGGTLPEAGFDVAGAPPLVTELEEEEELAEVADESTIVTALFVNGMTP